MACAYLFDIYEDTTDSYLAVVQGYTKLPDYVSVGQFPKTPLRDLFTAATPECLNLLGKCLLYDPKKRISAREVS